MVEIIAIIRPSKAAATKRKLCEIGHPAFTCVKVNGRGKLPVERVLADGSVIKTGLINKRLFIIEARDEEEEKIVNSIMEINSTGTPGDGKVFVMNLETTYSVREGFCKRIIG